MKSQRVRHAFAGTTRQTRLGPLDGLYPHPDEISVRHRDHAGNKLRDSVNTRTGFCVTARTALFNDPGAVCRPAARTSGAGVEPPRRDQTTGRWYDPQTGHVLRTTTDGEAPLPRTRIVEEPTLPATKVKRPTPKKPDSPRRAAHKAERRVIKEAPLTDDMIREYLRIKYGAKVAVITPKIRRAVKAAMMHAATVKAYSADLDKAKRKG